MGFDVWNSDMLKFCRQGIDDSFPNLRFSHRKARRIQNHFSKKIIREDFLPEIIRHVAGVDVAYTDRLSIGAVVVLDYPSMNVEEQKISCQRTCVPYKSGFLAFRELYPTITAIRKLKIKPDVFLVDGHGIAHPRHLGFASHLGLILNSSTVGVAKNMFCGEVKYEGNEEWKPIFYEDEMVGVEIFTKSGTKPVYVSIGHKVCLETAIRIVRNCVLKHRYPEPLRKAHMVAENEKRMTRQERFN